MADLKLVILTIIEIISGTTTQKTESRYVLDIIIISTFEKKVVMD